MIQTKLKEDPQIKCNLTHKYSKDVFVFCNAVRAGPTIEAKRMISMGGYCGIKGDVMMCCTAVRPGPTIEAERIISMGGYCGY